MIFDVYLGSTTEAEVAAGSATYRIVMSLVESLLDQGYIV